MYPLKLEPIYWDSIWGNDKLAKIRKNPKIRGTSWDVSAHPHADNVILNGEYEGKTLMQLLDEYPKQMLGNKNRSQMLRIAYLDARESLSIQVHPQNEYARIHENDEGKIREYFILFDDAFNCALGAMRDFTISKIKLHRGKTQWDEDDFEDGIIEYIKYKEGEPVWYWGSNFEGVKYDDDDENFETIEIPIPHPFEKGDMIRIVGTDDYGIVVEYGEGSEYELDGVGKVNKHESITIELVDENALFSHFHVLPSELEHANLPESDPLRELLRIAGYMSQGYGYLQRFQKECKKYLNSMRKKA